jgi:hypothetical protein
MFIAPSASHFAAPLGAGCKLGEQKHIALRWSVESVGVAGYKYRAPPEHSQKIHQPRPLAAYYLLLTTHCLLLTAYCSLLTAH